MKKLLTYMTLVLFMTTLLYANEKPIQNKHQEHHSKKQKMNMNFVNMVLNLKLGNAQRKKIYSIIKKSMDNLPNPEDAFSENSFDKLMYIALTKERRIMKLQAKAQLIEDVYALLTHEQRKDLRTMIEVKDIIRKKQKIHSKY